MSSITIYGTYFVVLLVSYYGTLIYRHKIIKILQCAMHASLLACRVTRIANTSSVKDAALCVNLSKSQQMSASKNENNHLPAQPMHGSSVCITGNEYKKLKFWLSSFDKDKDGVTDTDELKWMVDTMQEIRGDLILPSTDEDFHELLDLVDYNKDGKLTKDEFIEWIGIGISEARKNMAINKKLGNKPFKNVSKKYNNFWIACISWVDTCRLPKEIANNKISKLEEQKLQQINDKIRTRTKRKKNDSQNSRRGSVFSRLFMEGKKRLERKALRQKVFKNRMEEECSFLPLLKNGKTSISDIVDCVVESVVENANTNLGVIPRRDMLLLVYQNCIQRRELNASMTQTNKSYDRKKSIHESLYNDAEKKSKKMAKQEKKRLATKPPGCTFRPSISAAGASKKKKDTRLPKYLLKKANQNNNVDISKAKRHEILYMDGEIERSKRTAQIRQSCDKRDKMFTSVFVTNKTNAYNKKKHLHQIEKMQYLRQKKECTFSPKILRKNDEGKTDTRNPGEVVDAAIARLAKDDVKNRRKREVRRSQARLHMNGCTFKPSICKRSTESNESKKNRKQNNVCQRLYESGKKNLAKRDRTHDKRAKPLFKPDISKSKNYYEKIVKKKLLKHSPEPSPPSKPSSSIKVTSTSPLKRYRTSNYWAKNADSQVKILFSRMDKQKTGVIKRLQLLKAFAFGELGEEIMLQILSHPKLRKLSKPKQFIKVIASSSVFVNQNLLPEEKLPIGKKGKKVCAIRERAFLDSVKSTILVSK